MYSDAAFLLRQTEGGHGIVTCVFEGDDDFLDAPIRLCNWKAALGHTQLTLPPEQRPDLQQGVRLVETSGGLLAYDVQISEGGIHHSCVFTLRDLVRLAVLHMIAWIKSDTYVIPEDTHVAVAVPASSNSAARSEVARGVEDAIPSARVHVLSEPSAGALLWNSRVGGSAVPSGVGKFLHLDIGKGTSDITVLSMRTTPTASARVLYSKSAQTFSGRQIDRQIHAHGLVRREDGSLAPEHVVEQYKLKLPVQQGMRIRGEDSTSAWTRVPLDRDTAVLVGAGAIRSVVKHACVPLIMMLAEALEYLGNEKWTLVLAGGGASLAMVRDVIKDVLGHGPDGVTIHEVLPNRGAEAVARGCALHARQMGGATRTLRIQDVTTVPVRLDVTLENKQTAVEVIESFLPLPVLAAYVPPPHPNSNKPTFLWAEVGTGLRINVMQGPTDDPAGCVIVSQLRADDPPARIGCRKSQDGHVEVAVRVAVDVNGVAGAQLQYRIPRAINGQPAAQSAWIDAEPVGDGRKLDFEKVEHDILQLGSGARQRRPPARHAHLEAAAQARRERARQFVAREHEMCEEMEARVAWAKAQMPAAGNKRATVLFDDAHKKRQARVASLYQ